MVRCSDARAYGGGLEISGTCTLKAANCIFSANILGAGNGIYGAGVYVGVRLISRICELHLRLQQSRGVERR